MSQNHPKLATIYEEDPDFIPDESTSSNMPLRPKLDRKAKQKNTSNDNENKIESISPQIEINSSITPQVEIPHSFTPHVEIFNPITPHEEPTTSSVYNPCINTFPLNHSQIFSHKPTTMATKMSEEEKKILEIVQSVLANQTELTRTAPKIDLQKLTMSNYVDWSKKMKYALMLNNLWVDPNVLPGSLQGPDVKKNQQAVLFMACYLDEQNAAFINGKNEKCFITAWNAIKKFHQPRSATVLTDIHRQIQALRHQSGQPIESHLMKLEEQFSRFNDIDKSLSEEHLVALILASVSESPDFQNVFHSAMWEEESTLTIAKVKSVLISTQRRKILDNEDHAHHTKTKFLKNYQRSSNRSSSRRHNRVPQDPVNGWKCPDCEMDNHSREKCFKNQRKALNLQSKRANQVEDAAQNSNIAQAYAGTSIKSRLGAPVTNNSPYHNIVPNRVYHDSEDFDVLDIHYDSRDYIDMEYNDSDLEGSKSIKNLKISSNSFNFQQLNEYPRADHKNHFSSHQNKLNSIFSFANCAKIMNNKNELNTVESFWIVDSGATLTMCNSSKYLSNFIPHKGHNVIISDGSSIPICGYGTLKLNLKDLNTNLIHKLTLEKVAFVPNLSVNLISVRALASLGISIRFTENSCYIEQKRTKILLANISNSSYVMRMKHKTDSPQMKHEQALTCIHQWHRKLGHRNIQHIKRIQNSLNLKISKCENCPNECIACLKGKFHALPFPQTAQKPIHPRDVITSDVCGPFKKSIGGSEYFVTFNCACTDYTEVVAIRSKSDCKTELIKFLKRCHTQFGAFPKTLRSDQGGEYLDGELQLFLENNGIKFECAVARCPQQNGISERKNRTLLEAVRTMLLARDLPQHLWAEALHHANDTFNNIPKEPNSPSPKEKFFGKSFRPMFIEFGAPIFHLTNPQNRSKLAERGMPGIFLGFDHNSKGFRILTDKKIRVERHVRFLTERKDKSANNLSSQIDQTSQAPNQNSPTESEHNNVRRSERIRAKQANSAEIPDMIYEPKTYKQAISCPDKDKWIAAMDSELDSIARNNTWTEVDLPRDRTAIGSRWVFKVKNGENPEDIKYKARLVAQGFTQKFGVDYDEVFAPVTRSSTFRALLAISSVQNLVVQQYDVKSAFLNGTLNEEIYMKPPPGSSLTDKVLKLNKSLYGLKQAARVWNQTLHKTMTDEGFVQSKHDECLYSFKSDKNVCYAIVHVDDMIFASNSLSLIDTKIKCIQKSFELKCLGNVKNYLGIEVTRDQNGIFAISQSNYILKIASEFQLEDSKGSKYPLCPGYHSLTDTNVLDTNTDYRKLIGMLLYVSTNTRPDISASVCILAQRVSKPRKLDYTEALRIVKYLKSTKDEKLYMFDSQNSTPLTAYADSDWAEDRETRKSVSGVLCKVFGASISWSSRKQDIVSTSTTEAEFYALSEAVKEIQWLKNILNDFNIDVSLPITINSDNQSTIKMIENSKFSSRTKHIDVRLHFVRECVSTKKILLKYCASEDNIADLLTKPLAGVRMKFLRNLACLK